MPHGHVRRAQALGGQKGKSERNGQTKAHPLPILGMGCAHQILHQRAWVERLGFQTLPVLEMSDHRDCWSSRCKERF
jgi:hypothetical protein